MNRYEDVYYVPENSSLGMISTWFGVILILVTAVARIFSNRFSLNTQNPLVDGMEFLLIAFVFASLFHFAMRANHGLKLAALPLIINIGTFIIVRFVPFAGLWQEVRFQSHWGSYNEVVRLVESGAIQPNEYGVAQLPPSYHSLSKDAGTIMIDTSDGVTRIFFFTYYGTDQDFAGYLYRSDANPPQACDFNGRWRYIAQKRPHWFFCSSY